MRLTQGGGVEEGTDWARVSFPAWNDLPRARRSQEAADE
jgi:hypothetical protein